jgi:hypothetical protein
MKTTTAELVEMLRQKSRELRQSARRCDAAVAALLEPQKAQGRPVSPKRELYEAIKQSGRTYAQIAGEVGVSYRYISYVARGLKERPALEARIRECLAAHAEGAK